MNAAIELHDSECLEVEARDDGTGFVLLDAYVHRSVGRPGWEAGEGGFQRIRVTFENIKIDGVVGKLPACIYEGSLSTDDGVLDNMIELPGSYSGLASFKIMLSDDARVLTISGMNVTLLSESEFRFVECFDPGAPQVWSN